MDKERENRLQKLYDKEGRNTSSTDPVMMNSRVFIGNLPSDKVSRQDLEKQFESYGKILGISMHRSYGFVQFDNEESAKEAVQQTNGTLMFGLKLDVNIATERRKEPARQARSHSSKQQNQQQRRRPRSPSPPPPPPPPPRGYDRYRSYSPPPLPPPYRAPYREPSFERDPYYERYLSRDPYFYPRDDPYDRERYDRPPPRERLREYAHYSSRDYPPREPYDPLPLPPPASLEDYPLPREAEKRKGVPLEMEIIVVGRDQMEYGAYVRRRTEAYGIVTSLVPLGPSVTPTEVLDAAARRGLLYVVIITPQHETHRSLTLTILHGRNPQEHKNMPLDDALGLIAKDFEQYLSESSSRRRGEGSGGGGGGGGGGGTSISQLIGKLSANENLSSQELQTVISSLQQQAGGGSSFSSRPHEDSLIETDSDPQQQADLQAKILSLLGSSAALPAPQPTPLFRSSIVSSRQQYGQSEGNLNGRGYRGYSGGGGGGDFGFD